MELQEIIEQQAQYVRNSHVAVDIQQSMPWVSIYEQGNESRGIFLQGHEAEQFMQAITDLSAQLQDCTYEDLALSVAYPYTDLLSES